MQRLSLFILMISLCVASTAQDLFMPRDIQRAFNNGTRSADGKPGKKYWQNRARYAITVTATPPDRTIKGTETIVYTNNSPDTLRSVIIKLFLNIHKPGAPRNSPASEGYLTPGVQVNSLQIGGQKVAWPREQYTNQNIRLPKALMPADSVQLVFDWQYQISTESGREGMIDSTTYFLAYFYPRIAVYDDYNGWDRMPFMDSHEFYSDFNDYTVTLNVPRNYVVWGTGTLQKPETVLQPSIHERFTRSLSSDDIVHIATKADNDARRVTTANAMNAWTFTSNNIPDVAFGLSDHYVWDGTSVVVDKTSGRRASAQAAYNDTAADYHYVAGYARHSLNLLSHTWPGIPYPYEKTTVFQGYADMEYPMMANNSTFPDTVFSRFVAEHEIAHTYMPFYMGINETRYGFMDEGWATTFELLLGYQDLGKERAEQFFRQFRVQGWTNNRASDLQVPIIVPGDAMTGYGFGTNEYGKAALGYLAMKDMLGDTLFMKCLRGYMDRWNGKHPVPWDFFNSFNNISGRNLNWFWNSWFFGTGYNDLVVENVAKTASGYNLTVRNAGGFYSPADIHITWEDGSTTTQHMTAAAWEKNGKTTVVAIPTKKKIRSLKLDGGIFMDANTADNVYPAVQKAF